MGPNCGAVIVTTPVPASHLISSQFPVASRYLWQRGIYGAGTPRKPAFVTILAGMSWLTGIAFLGRACHHSPPPAERISHPILMNRCTKPKLLPKNRDDERPDQRENL